MSSTCGFKRTSQTLTTHEAMMTARSQSVTGVARFAVPPEERQMPLRGLRLDNRKE